MAARNEIDWVGMWFKLNKERGAEDRFCAGKADLSTNKVTWLTGIHSEMDGLGWLGHQLRLEGYNVPDIPKARIVKTPPFYRRPLLLYRAMKNLNKNVIPWKEFHPENKGKLAKELTWTYFTKEETEKIGKYAKSQGYSVQSFFIKLLNDVVVSQLVDGPYDGSWMFPVNMRGNVQFPVDTANLLGAIMLRTDNNTTPLEINNQIKELIKKDVHWGGWWLANIGKLVGVRGMRIISKISAKKTHNLGTYTHISDWPPPGSETEETKKKYAHDVWIGAPVGSPSYPISMDTIVTHGIMTLALKIHVSILSDQNKVNMFVQELKETALDLIK
jgi:hypothetical protein